ncbi:MAG TPA: hypothetical protein VGK10_13305 [Prolixibacteraceae bacterium]|jgi:hypothetical protein
MNVKMYGSVQQIALSCNFFMLKWNTYKQVMKGLKIYRHTLYKFE